MESLVLGVLLIALAVVAALGLLYGIRRTIPFAELEANHQVGNIIVAVVGTAYAVLLSFVVVVVWGAFGEAQQVSEQEASRLGSMFWLAGGLAPSDALRVQTAIRNYTAAVIDDEWPRLAHGQESDLAWQRHDDLWRAIFGLKETTPEQTAVYNQLLTTMTDADGARRLRLLASRDKVPTLLWVVLVAGGVATVLVTFLFSTKRFWPQAIMTATLTGLVAAVLLLVAAMDNPFGGVMHVTPDGFQSVLNLANRQLGQ